MDLSDFILVLDDILSPKMCQDILDTYSTNQELVERVEHQNKPNFNQLDLSKLLAEKNPEFHNTLSELYSKVWDIYSSGVSPHFECITKNFIWEGFRVKHYVAELGDSFDVHVDCMNKQTSTRMLAIFTYLNDVNEGGETLFPTLNIQVEPAVGRTVVFPPGWQYPHAGLAPISGDKYLLSSYIHFA